MGGAWVWLFWEYVYTMGVITGQFLFLLSVSTRLKKILNNSWRNWEHLRT